MTLCIFWTFVLKNCIDILAKITFYDQLRIIALTPFVNNLTSDEGVEIWYIDLQTGLHIGISIYFCIGIMWNLNVKACGATN